MADRALAGTVGTPAQAWPVAGAKWGGARTKEVQQAQAANLLE